MIISPILHRCIPRITRSGKTTVGMIIQFGRYITLITLIAVTRHNNYTNMPHTNITLCIFQENPSIPNDTTSLGIMNYKLYSIPEFISAISYIMILVGAIEFLCSQIPYSMKGLIVGIFYGSVVLASVLNRTISHIFTLKTSFWEVKAMFNCEFWYLLIKLIFLLAAIVSSLLVAVCYRKRKRDDVLPNEQIFVERYYSKKLQCT